MGRRRDKRLARVYRGKPCCVCGALNTEADHIITFGSGGPDDHVNLWPLCRYHHQEKGQIGRQSFIEKYPKLEALLRRKGWDYDDFNKKWYIPHTEKEIITYTRSCLQCSRIFETDNKFTRRCNRCKNNTSEMIIEENKLHL